MDENGEEEVNKKEEVEAGDRKEENNATLAANQSRREIVRLQQERGRLQATVTQLTFENGKLKDELEDAKGDVAEAEEERMKAITEIARLRESLEEAKPMIARMEDTTSGESSRLQELEQLVNQHETTLMKAKERHERVEEQERRLEEEKHNLAKTSYVARRLRRQLTTMAESSNEKQSALQNRLHAALRMVSELRLDCDEFTASMRAEWESEKQRKQQQYDQLKEKYDRLRSLQYEDKLRVLSESQDIVQAMQNQFEQFRQIAETLLRSETSFLETRLNTQMRQYEEELRHIVLRKDIEYDEMVLQKDSKMMALIDGSDMQELLVRHELELANIKQSHELALQNVARDLNIKHRQDIAVLQQLLETKKLNEQTLRDQLHAAEKNMSQ